MKIPEAALFLFLTLNPYHPRKKKRRKKRKKKKKRRRKRKGKEKSKIKLTTYGRRRRTKDDSISFLPSVKLKSHHNYALSAAATSLSSSGRGTPGASSKGALEEEEAGFPAKYSLASTSFFVTFSAWTSHAYSVAALSLHPALNPKNPAVNTTALLRTELLLKTADIFVLFLR
eukprot:TRINITY_DN8424_c6_g1_i1.p1 TRINITY_DN8424_c6_g1~~TRINITY_DN8424_c6_g1_i1.p1  ORF type:complete len:173 (-),score=18.84 TRINITY_DN8424_c6_g1_i1:38-556(-)